MSYAQYVPFAHNPIGLTNLCMLTAVYKSWRKLKEGEPFNRETMEDYLSQKIFGPRWFKPLVNLIDRSWKMYPLGVLFGYACFLETFCLTMLSSLGFDTATEVALIALSVLANDNGFPAALVVLLPLLFVAGMSLVSTLP